MLRSALLLLALLSTLPAFCQNLQRDSATFNLDARLSDLETRNQLAGKELQVFRKDYFTGAALQATGVSLLVISIAISQKHAFNTGIAVGGAIAISGTLVMIGSHTRLNRAGLYLSENGLTVPIKRRKR